MSSRFITLTVPGTDQTVSGLVELPDDLFVSSLDAMRPEDWSAAAELARTRLKRCRPGSLNWRWYTAVVAEQVRGDAQ